MADHRLVRRDGDTPRVLAQGDLDGLGLGDVAGAGGRAVGVDVVDRRRLETGLLERHLHGAGLRLAGLVRQRHVEGVRAHAGAGQLGVDAGAAGLGVLEALEHQATGALADHETVAAGVEGPRGMLRVVVAQAERAGGGKAGHADRAHGRLAAAGEHHLGVAVADDARRVADGVGAGGAGGNGGAQRALGAQLERDVRRAHVGDHHRHEQRVHAVRALGEELVDLGVQRLQAADAAADHRPDPVRLGAGVELGVGGRQLGGRDRVPREEVEPPHLALVDEVLGVEVLDLGGDVHLVVAGVEARDRPDARLAGDEPPPERVDVVAQRRDHAETGDDDSGGGRHQMPNPPSTGSVTPVTKRACGEARKTTAWATSSVVPMLLSGVASTISLRVSSGRACVIGVSM